MYEMPRQLDDGLLMRWAKFTDSEELAEFNLRWHSEDPDGDPEIWLKAWTRDLLSGNHPTTKADNISVVVDESKRSKIVSSMALIPQTWTYDGIAFGCGRPELIATDPNYRHRGLVRHQFEVIHAQSSAQNDLVQGITGIPWYYRQFGYEMALDLGGGRILPASEVKELKADQAEIYRIRKANSDDLPFLQQMYAQLCDGNLIACNRDTSIWNYELRDDGSVRDGRRNLWIIETFSGFPVAYAALKAYPRADAIFELEVVPGHAVRAVSLFLARHLKAQASQLEPQRSMSGLTFKLGASHPVYDALHQEMRTPLPSYAWFLRVPDLPRFLQHISPVLEKRISTSVVTGYDGSLKLNFYRRQLKMDFKEGRLINIEPYEPKHFFDGDSFFSELTFLQLLFGYRSMDELTYAHTDCFTGGGDQAILLEALFPKQHSKVVSLS